MQTKNKDLALEQLQRDKESATVTKEELRTQMQSLSDDQSNTHAKAYALQKHAEKLQDPTCRILIPTGPLSAVTDPVDCQAPGVLVRDPIPRYGFRKDRETMHANRKCSG